MTDTQAHQSEQSNFRQIGTLVACFIAGVIIAIGAVDVYETATYFYSQEYWGRALRLRAWLDDWRAWGFDFSDVRMTHGVIEQLDALIVVTLIAIPAIRAVVIYKLIVWTVRDLDDHLPDDVNRNPVEALPTYWHTLCDLYRIRWLYSKRLVRLTRHYVLGCVLFAAVLFITAWLYGLAMAPAALVAGVACLILALATPFVLPLLFGDRLPPYPAFQTLDEVRTELDPDYIDPVDPMPVSLQGESLPGTWANGTFVDGTAGVFTRYQQDATERRQLICSQYEASLRELHPNFKPEPISIDVGKLADDGKRLYLPVVIGATSAKNTFDMLDLDRSHFHADRLIYRSQQKGIDIEHWKDSISAIERYLGGRWSVDTDDGTTVVVSRVPTVPPSFDLDPSWIREGEIFLGRNLTTGQPVHIKLDHMTHTLVAGPNGVGKSVFLNQVITSLLANIEHIDRIYLADLKFGMELRRYAGEHDNITVMDTYDGIVEAVSEVLTLMEERGRDAADRSLTHTDAKPIFFIVDEFAQVTGYPAEKKAKDALMADIAKISMLGRAIGIRLFLQVQRATTDAIPGNIKHNLVTKIAFRHPSNTDAARDIFGVTEGLPLDITTLRQGQFIFRDGRTSDTTPVQAAFMKQKP